MKRFYLYCLGLLIATPSYAAWEDTSSLQAEVNRIKDDIVVIQRQLYRDKNDRTAPAESVSNVQVRMGEYDQLIRDMNGKVENIEYRLNTLEKKMEMIDKDIELRFNQIKRQGDSAAPASSSTNAAALKSTAVPSVLPKAPAGVSSKDLYEQALTDLKNNKLSDAELKFSQFLGSYPKDALAGNAQYWLGEVYYKQQNFAKAAVAFKNGYSKYPEGTKGPDCLLKLGLSMKGLGKKTEACTAFINIPTIFGKVSPDIAKRAEDEAKALSCK
ncbi:MAG: tol-pal system protein YbgF [Alphaproteobacteria bacterium]|nr:tol-pal system protein YbgF [Alphaproteobacteria bacterium]